MNLASLIITAVFFIMYIAGKVTQQWPLSATVDLDTMEYSMEIGAYNTVCRCGGSYTITEGEMEEGVDTVCCSRCSLAIRVLYQVAEEETEEREHDM